MDSFVQPSSVMVPAAAFSAVAGGLLMPVEALTQGFDLAPDMASVASADRAVLAQLQDLQIQQMQALATPALESGATAPAVPVAGLATIAAMQPTGAGALLAGNASEEQRQGFVVGDVGLMIGYEDGSELTEIPALHYLPNAPAWCLGVANLHGNMVPVFDLASYLGIADSRATDAVEDEKSKLAASKRMLLVLAHGPDAAGVVIDGMPERLYITADQQMPPDVAPDLLLPHVRSAVFVEGRMWFDLQCASLLDALENHMQTV